MSKKILILGAKGNLGSQLVKVFSASDKVIDWDREEIDITNQKQLASQIEEAKPDIIINTAAYNAVDKCEEDDQEFERAKQLNAEAVGYLANIALEIKAMLVHYISDYVFPGDKKDGYKEDDETGAISRYGESKLMGENEILKRRDRDFKFYLIRTSKLFGSKGTSQAAKESFFDLIWQLYKEGQREFNMVHNEEISCFTYTPDLAQATKELIETKQPYGIYHLVNKGAASWYDGAKYLFKLKNVTDVNLNPISSADYPRPAKRPKYSVLLNTKLVAMRNWREALREYLRKTV